MVFNVTLTCTFSWLKSFTLCTSSSCTRSSSDVVAGWHLMFDSSCHWNPQIEWLDVQSGAVSSDLFNIRVSASKFHFWGISFKPPDYSTNKSLKRCVCPVINVSCTMYIYIHIFWEVIWEFAEIMANIWNFDIPGFKSRVLPSILVSENA